MKPMRSVPGRGVVAADSCDQSGDDVSLLDAGQLLLQALILEGQPLVIDA